MPPRTKHCHVESTQTGINSTNNCGEIRHSAGDVFSSKASNDDSGFDTLPTDFDERLSHPRIAENEQKVSVPSDTGLEKRHYRATKDRDSKQNKEGYRTKRNPKDTGSISRGAQHEMSVGTREGFGDTFRVDQCTDGLHNSSSRLPSRDNKTERTSRSVSFSCFRPTLNSETNETLQRPVVSIGVPTDINANIDKNTVFPLPLLSQVELELEPDAENITDAVNDGTVENDNLSTRTMASHQSENFQCQAATRSRSQSSPLPPCLWTRAEPRRRAATLDTTRGVRSQLCRKSIDHSLAEEIRRLARSGHLLNSKSNFESDEQ